jgi:hypothetical protein
VFVVLDAVTTMDLDLLRRQRFMQQAQPCIDAARPNYWMSAGIRSLAR